MPAAAGSSEQAERTGEAGVATPALEEVETAETALPTRPQCLANPRAPELAVVMADKVA